MECGAQLAVDVHGPASARRRAAHRLGRDLALRLQRARKVVPAAERNSGRLEPIFGEGPLELLDDGPLDPHVGVAPVILRPAIASPLPARARAAGDRDLAVHYEDAAVIAIVELFDLER